MLVFRVCCRAGVRLPPPAGSTAIKTEYQLPVQRSEATAWSTWRVHFP